MLVVCTHFPLFVLLWMDNEMEGQMFCRNEYRAAVVVVAAMDLVAD